MEFKNYFSRENLLSKYLRTGIALLAMAAIVGCAQPTVFQTVPLSQEPQLETLTEVCDYAVREQGGINNAVDRRTVEPIITEEVTVGNIQAIKELPLTKNTIVRIGEEKAYKVLLAPVGYPENPETNAYIAQLTRDLSTLYRLVNVDFSYLTLNVPIGIQHIDRYATLSNGEEAHALWLKANAIQPINDILFILNVPTYMGSGGTGSDGNRYAVIGGTPDESLFMAAHEFAHHLKLSDGYQRFLGIEGLGGTELFTDTHYLRDDVRTAYINLTEPPQPQNTTMRCGSDQVFTFYADTPTNLMKNRFTDDEIQQIDRERGSIFNPLQLEVMNDFINQVTGQ